MAHPSAGGAEGCTTSVHEFFDRLIQLVDGLLVAGLHSVGQTVVDVILQDNLCCVVERRAHGCELDEHLGTVASVLYHALDRLQMADRAGQPVDDRLGLRVGVRVRVGVPLAAVAVGDDVAVLVHVRVHHRVGILFRHGVSSPVISPQFYRVLRRLSMCTSVTVGLQRGAQLLDGLFLDA